MSAKELISLPMLASIMGVSRSYLTRLADKMGFKPDQSDTKHLYLDMESCHKIIEHMGKKVGQSQGAPYVMSFVNCFPNTFKTTIVLNYAHYLRLIGYRVLVIDLDNKASISQYYRGDDEIIRLSNKDSIGALLTSPETLLEDLIQKTGKYGVDLVPSCYELFNAELNLAKEIFSNPQMKYWNLLKGRLESLPYDVVLIDTASVFNYLTVSAIVESNTIIIPGRNKRSSIEMLKKQIGLINGFYDEISLRGNEEPTMKFILTNEEPESYEEEVFIKSFMEEHALAVYKKRIPYSKEINNANFHKRSLFEEEVVTRTHHIKKTRNEEISVFEEMTKDIHLSHGKDRDRSKFCVRVNLNFQRAI